MELGKGFYIDDAFNVKLSVSDGNDIEIPWRVIHRAVELQKARPMHKRVEIKLCEVCGEPVHQASYQKHLLAHGK